MYTRNEIQIMINKTNQYPKLKNAVLKHFSGRDLAAINDVLADGYYERFDRYDSDVCEQFITAIEKEIR